MTTTIRAFIAGALLSASLLCAGFLGAAHLAEPQPTAVIGASKVPALDCEEDEVIAYVQTGPTPYKLGCVHGDAVYEGDQP